MIQTGALKEREMEGDCTQVNNIVWVRHKGEKKQQTNKIKVKVSEQKSPDVFQHRKLSPI